MQDAFSKEHGLDVQQEEPKKNYCMQEMNFHGTWKDNKDPSTQVNINNELMKSGIKKSNRMQEIFPKYHVSYIQSIRSSWITREVIDFGMRKCFRSFWRPSKKISESVDQHHEGEYGSEKSYESNIRH